MARRTKRDYILPAWVGPVVTGGAPWGARPEWRKCTGTCGQKMLTTDTRPLCMACDPDYVQIQPGVYSKRTTV